MPQDNEKEIENGSQPDSWLKRWVLPIAGLAFIVALVVFITVNAEEIEDLQQYGYLGVFLISVLLNATLVLPAGNFIILAALGGTLGSPLLVGVLGGLGAGIGESTGYLAGFSGRAIIQKQSLYKRMEKWLKKWGSWVIFGMAAAPLFFDLMGIAAGVLRFPYWRFFVATWLGRTVLYVIIAYAGAMGWDTLIDFFNR
jgi:uncharacterized membrane protein YdjX (TVP38/TMEM64 family)